MDLYAGFHDDIAPRHGFGRDALLKFAGALGSYADSGRAKSRRRVRIFERGDCSPLDLISDIQWRLLRSKQLEPGAGVERG